MEKFGTQQSHFTKIAAKNKRHSVNNPYSQFRIEMTEEQVRKKSLFLDFNSARSIPTSKFSRC